MCVRVVCVCGEEMEGNEKSSVLNKVNSGGEIAFSSSSERFLPLPHVRNEDVRKRVIRDNVKVMGQTPSFNTKRGICHWPRRRKEENVRVGRRLDF